MIVHTHNYDSDAVCLRCGFDGAEHAHLNQVRPDLRSPTPLCHAHEHTDVIADPDYDRYANVHDWDATPAPDPTHIPEEEGWDAGYEYVHVEDLAEGE